MPDGVAAKGAAKTKADKPKNNKGRVEPTGEGAFGKVVGLYNTIKRFFRESYNEVFKKASWPSWPEVQKNTMIVILAVVVVLIWIGGLDYVMSKLTSGWLYGAKRP